MTADRKFVPRYGRRLRLGWLLASLLATTSAAEFDPRNFEDLTNVIGLCASAPDSWEFDSAWLSWVRANPDADLDDAIATVISRAGTIHSMTVSGLAPRRPASMPSTTDLTRRMEDLARSATSGSSHR